MEGEKGRKSGGEGVVDGAETGLIPRTFILKFLLVCFDGLEPDDRLSCDLFADMHTVAKRH